MKGDLLTEKDASSIAGKIDEANLTAFLENNFLNNPAAPCVVLLNPVDNFRLCSANQTFKKIQNHHQNQLCRETCFPDLTSRYLQQIWTEVQGTGLSHSTTRFCVGGVCIIVEMNFGIQNVAGQNLLIAYLWPLTKTTQSHSTSSVECVENRCPSVLTSINDSDFLFKILQSIPDFIWFINLEGVFLASNTAFDHFFGVNEAELIGKPVNQTFNAAVVNFLQLNDDKALAQGNIYIYEEWFQPPHAQNANPILFEIRKIALLGADGGILGILALARDITQNKHAESASRENQDKLHDLYELSPLGIVLNDMAGNYIDFNAAFKLITGYSETELKSLNFWQLTPYEYADKEQAQLNALQTLGRYGPYEKEYIQKNGNRISIQLNGTLIRDKNGDNFIWSIVEDITERKNMLAALRQREEEFRILVESSLDLIIRYDKDCKRKYVNPAVVRATGKSPLALLNSSPADAQLFTQHDAKELETKLRYVLKTGECTEIETELLNNQGRLLYFHNWLVPEFADDRQISGVICMSRDISKRKKTEALLFQREREIRTLLENLPIIIIRYDLNLRRIYVNSAFIKIFNIPISEILGKSIAEVWWAKNINSSDYTRILQQVINTGEKTDVTLEWIGPTNQLISHVVSILPEYNADGKVISLLSLGVDFTFHRQQQLIEKHRQRVFEKMAEGNDLSDILQQVAFYVETSDPSVYCTIILFNEQQILIEIIATPNLPTHIYQTIKQTVSVELDNFKKILQDDSNNKLNQAHSFECELGQYKSSFAPVFSNVGQLLGIVNIHPNENAVLDQSNTPLLRQASHLCSIAIERKRIETKMNHQASYDLLTNLPNRQLFIKRLQEEASKCRRNGERIALLFIDLYHFKEVNDSLGHIVGDQLLVQVSERIKLNVREEDIVARLAGDEFVVIISYAGDNAIAWRVGEHIVASLSQPFQLGKSIAHISASIGIACYPDDTDDIDLLLGCADQSMYSVKKNGRNGVAFFTPALQNQAQERLILGNDLRLALKNNQLALHFQPIISTLSGKIEKAEALLRWYHPQRGLISPQQFIPLAEETSTIIEIGDWVFREAANMALKWRKHNLTAQISVNMSPVQFVRGSSDATWIDYLKSIALTPTAIVIEITEGLLLDDQNIVKEKLSNFQQFGVQLALDDFGTGYSAMGYLKKFNINYLKIDRSFVRDLDRDASDRAISEAIVVMAHKLGIKVIAEGVETAGQSRILSAVDCDFLQGYLFAKPMPAKDFITLISK